MSAISCLLADVMLNSLIYKESSRSSSSSFTPSLLSQSIITYNDNNIRLLMFCPIFN